MGHDFGPGLERSDRPDIERVKDWVAAQRSSALPRSTTTPADDESDCKTPDDIAGKCATKKRLDIDSLRHLLLSGSISIPTYHCLRSELRDEEKADAPRQASPQANEDGCCCDAEAKVVPVSLELRVGGPRCLLGDQRFALLYKLLNVAEACATSKRELDNFNYGVITDVISAVRSELGQDDDMCECGYLDDGDDQDACQPPSDEPNVERCEVD